MIGSHTEMNLVGAGMAVASLIFVIRTKCKLQERAPTAMRIIKECVIVSMKNKITRVNAKVCVMYKYLNVVCCFLFYMFILIIVHSLNMQNKMNKIRGVSEILPSSIQRIYSWNSQQSHFPLLHSLDTSSFVLSFLRSVVATNSSHSSYYESMAATHSVSATIFLSPSDAERCRLRRCKLLNSMPLLTKLIIGSFSHSVVKLLQFELFRWRGK